MVSSVNTSSKFANPEYLAAVTAEYQDNATGVLAFNLGTSFAGFRIPDDVLLASNDTFHLQVPADRPHLLLEGLLAPLMATPEFGNRSVASLFSALIQPESSGYIRLNSSDYRDNPLIYSNYYGSDNDMAAILYGYKRLRSIVNSEAMRSVVVGELFPGPDATTDEQLIQAIKQSAQSFFHPVGSASLGKVLDKQFRIKGLQGIRVVDSSAIPVLNTCHTQAPTYALAHRAAKIILRQWNESKQMD